MTSTPMTTVHVKRGNEWVPVPLPQSVTLTTVYHYTSPSGLLGILEKNCLWASSALSLNDLSEVTYGFGVVKEVLEERKGSTFTDAIWPVLGDETRDSLRDAAFFLSASAHGDSLNQWLGYSGKQGYAVGLDTSVNLVQLTESDQEIAYLNHNLVSGWFDVIYDRDRQRQAVNVLLDFLEQGHVPGSTHTALHARLWLGTLLVQFKHPAFRDEREVRYLATRLPSPVEYFRAGAYGVVPYVKLVTREPGEYFYTRSSGRKLPIVSVACGPLNAEERLPAMAATRRLLAATGYSADVAPSDAPYRY
jgi:hypothetical protein